MNGEIRTTLDNSRCSEYSVLWFRPLPKYEHLFGNNIQKQMEVAAIIYENYTERKKKIG